MCWRAICEDVGLGKLRLHNLRHTLAGHAVMSGEYPPRSAVCPAVAGIERGPCTPLATALQGRLKIIPIPFSMILALLRPPVRNPRSSWPEGGEASGPAKGEQHPLGERSGSRCIHMNWMVF